MDLFFFIIFIISIYLILTEAIDFVMFKNLSKEDLSPKNDFNKTYAVHKSSFIDEGTEHLCVKYTVQKRF